VESGAALFSTSASRIWASRREAVASACRFDAAATRWVAAVTASAIFFAAGATSPANCLDTFSPMPVASAVTST
jgi:hypothetical protein